MTIFIALLIITTVAQTILCHLSLSLLISILMRILFSCRMIGASFKVKKLAIGEGLAIGGMLLWNILFHGDSMPWLRILLYIVFSGLSLGIMFLDDLLYVYSIEDVEE